MFLSTHQTTFFLIYSRNVSGLMKLADKHKDTSMAIMFVHMQLHLLASAEPLNQHAGINKKSDCSCRQHALKTLAMQKFLVSLFTG